MKRKETIELENALTDETKKKRIYGCEEITIGFHNNGHGNEIVDFMTMDSKGILKCYELKITIQDLKSSAKKSWYGHFNYLVTTIELYEKIDNWDDYIPKDVGIIVGYGIQHKYLESKRKAKRNNITKECEIMLKESMVRSIYFKMIKYKKADSIEREKELTSNIRKLTKEKNEYEERARKAESIIFDYEGYTYALTGKDIDLQADAKKMKEKYLSRFKNKRTNC